MRKVKFHSDKNKMSMQKKENSMPRYNNEYEGAIIKYDRYRGGRDLDGI